MKFFNKKYNEYLNSPEWQRKKRGAYIRDNGQCKRCHRQIPRDETSDTHHLTYKRLGNEDMDDLQTLCRSCHDLLHECRQFARSNWKEYLEWRQKYHSRDWELIDQDDLFGEFYTYKFTGY